MAAIALMGSVIMGCSESDLVENMPQSKAVMLSTTISLDGSSATTRALDAAGKKTFAADEQVALIYESAENGAQKVISAKLKATDISSDKKKATLTFTLEKAPKTNGDFAMIYPASMAPASLPSSGAFGDIAAPNYTALASQDGTLESLSSNLDLAYCESTFSSNATFPGGISLTNQLAILELTIKNYAGTSDLTNTIKSLTITQGTTTYSVTPAAPATTFGDAPLYVAMRPVSNGDFTVSATDGANWFEKTVTSQSLAANSMTPINIRMWKKVELSHFTTDGQEYTAQNGEMLYGTLAKYEASSYHGAYKKISIADGADIALKDVTIYGPPINTYLWAGLTCKGDATIVLEGTNIVAGFDNYYPGIYVPGDKNDPSKNNTLIIKGTGSLTVGRETSNGACIGSGHKNSDNADCGNIEIQGGTIIAQAGANGAGIGCGEKGSCGSITISGGYVDAKGKGYSAGIGSANEASTCGDITISGGTVIAKGTYAAGIGSGYKTSCGNITISGGTIEATGDNNGAGIGSSDTGKCGSIMISDGNITATGGDNGAGIGCGSSPTVSSQCGNITITGGSTKAIGKAGGASIGHGLKNAICGTITFGSAMVYTGDDTSTTPVTSGNWDPNPLTAGNYGGLTLSISTTTTANDTWTLTQ